MEDELIPVNLWVAGRSYRLRIRRDDERAIRQAVKNVSDKVNEFRNMFSGKDDQDFLAMCLLMYASEQAIVKDNLNTNNKIQVENMIKQIEQSLEKLNN